MADVTVRFATFNGGDAWIDVVERDQFNPVRVREVLWENNTVGDTFTFTALDDAGAVIFTESAGPGGSGSRAISGNQTYADFPRWRMEIG